MRIIFEVVTILATAAAKQENWIAEGFTSASNIHIQNLQDQNNTAEIIKRNELFSNTNWRQNYEEYKSEAVNISSDNYPKPYPPSCHKVWNIANENSTGFELIVEFLDIAPNTDFLKIYMNSSVFVESDVTGIILTGTLKAPFPIRTLNADNLRIEFTSNTLNAHEYKGFRLTYTPYGVIPDPVVKPPDKGTISPESASSYTILLAVHEIQQNNETWELFRSLLCDATNNYTIKHNLTLEPCHTSNVSFNSIAKCSKLWPTNGNCIELDFRISLNYDEVEVSSTTEYPLNGPEVTWPTELTVEKLKLMWTEYGQYVFRAHDFPQYNPPETSGLIWFWAGMASASLLVFLMFLILLSKTCMLTFHAKWPPVDEDKQNILKNDQGVDITMFPSPHQIVPTLFPSATNPYTPGSSFLYGGDVYENRPRDAVECFNETDPRLLSGLKIKSLFEADSPNSLLNGKDQERLHPLDHSSEADEES